MSAYNRWMNQRIYALCEEIPDARRKRDIGAFFKSIHGTLNHILLADRVWIGRFKHQPFVVAALDQELYADFSELRAEREKTDQEIEVWVESLTAADLGSELHYQSIVNPTPKSHPMGFALMHFFNHQTHHRGQITTLLSQLGIDPGVTDLLWLPESQ